MENYHLETMDTFKYITEKNAYIYRPIVRYMYNKHIRLDHNGVSIQEIYKFLKSEQILSESFTEIEVQEWMNRLEIWEVVYSQQEKQKGMTIEEFKRKRYLYQMTALGLEVEALLIRLDEMDERLVGQLDSKQFEKLFIALEIFSIIEPTKSITAEKITELWNNVFETYKRLRKNAADYLYIIQEAEKKNLFNTELFLEYKDNIMRYLGTFVTELERRKYKLIKLVLSIEDDHIQKYVEALIHVNKASVILYDDYSEERLRANLTNKWLDMKRWFVGASNSVSDIDILGEKTRDAIRLIVTYANRLSDSMANAQNRINDYKTLARKFIETNSGKDAKKLYVCAFGAEQGRSIYVNENLPLTEDGRFTTADDIWPTEIRPYTVPNMSNRGPKGGSKSTSLRNNRLEQQRLVMETLRKQREEEEKLMALFTDGKITMSEIGGLLDSSQRRILLKWLDRTSKKKDGILRTSTGMKVRVNRINKRRVSVTCSDGILHGYDVEFEIQGD